MTLKIGPNFYTKLKPNREDSVLTLIAPFDLEWVDREGNACRLEADADLCGTRFRFVAIAVDDDGKAINPAHTPLLDCLEQLVGLHTSAIGVNERAYVVYGSLVDTFPP